MPKDPDGAVAGNVSATAGNQRKQQDVPQPPYQPKAAAAVVDALDDVLDDVLDNVLDDAADHDSRTATTGKTSGPEFKDQMRPANTTSQKDRRHQQPTRSGGPNNNNNNNSNNTIFAYGVEREISNSPPPEPAIVHVHEVRLLQEDGIAIPPDGSGSAATGPSSVQNYLAKRFCALVLVVLAVLGIGLGIGFGLLSSSLPQQQPQQQQQPTSAPSTRLPTRMPSASPTLLDPDRNLLATVDLEFIRGLAPDGRNTRATEQVLDDIERVRGTIAPPVPSQTDVYNSDIAEEFNRYYAGRWNEAGYNAVVIVEDTQPKAQGYDAKIRYDYCALANFTRCEDFHANYSVYVGTRDHAMMVANSGANQGALVGTEQFVGFSFWAFSVPSGVVYWIRWDFTVFFVASTIEWDIPRFGAAYERRPNAEFPGWFFDRL